MRAVTFQAPGEVRVDERPDPELHDPGDAVVRVEATGVCGSDPLCRAGSFHRCERSRTFGHGAALGGLQGTQAELALVPHADLTLRRVPDGMPVDVALFAGDVMGTGYHAATAVRPGDAVAVLGLGPVGLCAVQAALGAGAAQVIAIDSVQARLEMARAFGAAPVHLTEDDPRAAVKAATDGRGVAVAIEAGRGARGAR